MRQFSKKCLRFNTWMISPIRWGHSIEMTNISVRRIEKFRKISENTQFPPERAAGSFHVIPAQVNKDSGVALYSESQRSLWIKI